MIKQLNEFQTTKNVSITQEIFRCKIKKENTKNNLNLNVKIGKSAIQVDKNFLMMK